MINSEEANKKLSDILSNSKLIDFEIPINDIPKSKKANGLSFTEKEFLDAIGINEEDINEKRSFTPKEMAEGDAFLKSIMDGTKPATHIKSASERVEPATVVKRVSIKLK